MNRSELLSKHPEFIEGMPVKSLDGKWLGKVVFAGDEEFIIEKGFFFPEDIAARYEDVVAVSDGELVVGDLSLEPGQIQASK
jgi:hypothetical protein